MSAVQEPSPELAERIDALRERLATATDFSVPFVFFDEHIAQVPDLLDCSETHVDQGLVRLLERGAEQAIPGYRLDRVMMFRVPGKGFWHGLAMHPLANAFFFYWDDPDLGLLALVTRTGRTHFVRLSTIELPAPGFPGTRGSA